MAGKYPTMSAWQMNQANQQKSNIKSLTKDVQRLDIEQDQYFGGKLVKKVYDDLTTSTLKDQTTAWGSALEQIQKDTVKHLREVSRKPKNDLPEERHIKMTAEGRKKNIIKIAPVKPLPTMLYWTETPINIPTPDSKYLTHIPYLGEEHAKKDKKGAFGEELVEMYDGKVHSDDCSNAADEDQFYHQNIDLVHFIRVLMEISKKYGEAIFSDEEISEIKPNKDLTSAYLQRIYKRVKNAREEDFALKKPSSTLLAAASSVFPDVPSEGLQKRYLSLSLSRNSEFNRSKNAPCNLDEDGCRDVQTKDAQMDSYRSLFCRICFQYACPQHELLFSADEIATIQSVVKLEREQNKKVKKTWIRGSKNSANECQFEDCCRHDNLEEMPPPPLEKNSSTVRRNWDKLLRTWTPTERTLFNCHYDTFKDYCLVGLAMRSKSCREVMEYHRLNMIMGNESQKPASTKETAASTSSANVSTRMNSDEAFTTSSSSGYESLNSSLNVTSELSNEEIVARQLSTFIPCCHENGVCNEDCSCVTSKKFCESSCACFKSCKNRFKGCNCLTTCDTNRCPCFIAHRECDPDLCKNCRSHEMDLEKVSCKNVAIQRKLIKSVYIAKSTVSGWGAFAGEDIKRGELIDEYTAEMISTNEAEKRGHVYDEKRHTFLFELTDGINLDASRLGSFSRFINSSKRPNCQPIKTNVRGEIRLAIRALKDIGKGSELFMNYHKALLTSKRKTGVKRCRKYLDE